jgi:farnesyl-diphosphate farnesyltransferase
MESMGQFLQQVNITRDIKEDLDDGRRFWPREIWSKHVDKFEDLFKPENKEKALNASSEMILTALTRADDCLYYLAGLREQSVFNFCAIPQSMAIATLETCFQNYAIFEKNVKITKGEACQLMIDSTQNLQLVCEVFKKYSRKIHKKNNPHDPNFLKISITLARVSLYSKSSVPQLTSAKIEQFIESIFPSQKPPVDNTSPVSIEEAERKRKEDEESKWDMIYMVSAVLLTVGVITFFMVHTLILAHICLANHVLALYCLDGWCSLRHCLLPIQRTARRTSWLGCFQRDKDCGSDQGCRGSPSSQRALERRFITICLHVS